jgi:hypothetical protein
MFAVLVPEVIIDALLLHQPADEVEIRLAILHAVFPGPVLAAELFREVGETIVLENLLDDFGHLLFLEDPAVGLARQQPEPGPQRRMVTRKLTHAALVRELADIAVEVTGLALSREVEAHGKKLAHHIVELDVVVLAQQIEVEFERLA